MQKLIVNVTDELHKALQARRAATDVPTTVFIRRMLQKVLADEQTWIPQIEKRNLQPVLIPQQEEKC